MTDTPEPRVTSASLRLGALLAVVGGFLDAYTYVGRGHVFANSQTGNFVLLGVEAARGEWRLAFRHAPPIVAFILGGLVAETLKHPRLAAYLRWPARVAMALEIAVLALVGVLPSSVPDTVVTLTIAFVASLQVSMFRTLIRWPYNTTMATGNLRTAAQAAFHAFVDRDRESAEMARAFAAVIVAFAGGALLGGWCTLQTGPRAVWLAATMLIGGLSLFIYDDRQKTPAASPR